MDLKLERNGRMWEGNSGPEEVLDVFYGTDYKKKVSRGLCHSAFKEVIKQKLGLGEALFISVKIKENGQKSLENPSPREK